MVLKVHRSGPHREPSDVMASRAWLRLNPPDCTGTSRGLAALARTVVLDPNYRKRDRRPYGNQRIEDKGMTVHFKRKAREQVIACDKWTRSATTCGSSQDHRGAATVDTWGTREMVDAAFAGSTAIPATANAGVRRKRPWYQVLDEAADAPRGVMLAAGKALQRRTPHTRTMAQATQPSRRFSRR
jgi:hypothetical protein